MSKLAVAQGRLMQKNRGAILAEYALLAVLIAMVCVLAVISLGEGALGLMTAACSAVSTAVSGAPAC